MNVPMVYSRYTTKHILSYTTVGITSILRSLSAQHAHRLPYRRFDQTTVSLMRRVSNARDSVDVGPVCDSLVAGSVANACVADMLNFTRCCPSVTVVASWCAVPFLPAYRLYFKSWAGFQTQRDMFSRYTLGVIIWAAGRSIV